MPLPASPGGAPDDAAEELELEAEPLEWLELLEPVLFEPSELLEPVLFEPSELLEPVLFELSELLELEPFEGEPEPLELELVALGFVPPVEEDSEDPFKAETLDCDALVLDDDSEGRPFSFPGDGELHAATTMPPVRKPILR